MSRTRKNGNPGEDEQKTVNRPCSPYDCSKHGVPMVLEVLELSAFGRAMTNIERVTFFRCPVFEEVWTGQGDGTRRVRCNQMKPNKREKRYG